MRASVRPAVSSALAVALVLALAVPAVLLAAPAPRGKAAKPAADYGVPELPFETFTLSNGLRVVVHSDHSSPVVAVNVWYHVGSKNEKPGRTGFAHLFEHLMFNGSENFNQDFFKPFERAGATSQNGTTNSDRTNYFENMPSTALDMALWLESDRMGHLLGAIDQPKLDEQRGVVKNEKRQGENQPYGRSFAVMAENTYPAGHPYSWTTIGSMEDLDAATIDDVKEWFRAYYGAANAVLVLAGDVSAADGKAMAEKYFGDVAPGPPVTRPQRWIAPLDGPRRITMQDQVTQTRVTKVWNIPEYGSDDAIALNLASDVLSRGKTSRLNRRLVLDDRTATAVSASIWAREIAGQFTASVTVAPGADAAAAEAALVEEVGRMALSGPTAKELEVVKAQYVADVVRGMERVGGFSGRSDLLASSMVYSGRPDAWREQVLRGLAMKPADVQSACQRWLGANVFTLEVTPFPKLHAGPAIADRSQVPAVGVPQPAKFPERREATLANGLRLIVAERHSIPQVLVRLLVDAGAAADQHGEAGTASLGLDLMDEGTATRTNLELEDELARLGAELTLSSNVDISTVGLSALRSGLDEALALQADVVLHPSFPEAEFARLKAEQIAAVGREMSQPNQVGLRILPRLLYGEGHAYSNPATGSGTEESVGRITRQMTVDFHAAWFKPNNATLVIVGDTTLDEMRPKIEALYGGWAKGQVPAKALPPVPAAKQSALYLLDRPGAVQSVILAAQLAPARTDAGDLALETMNRVLGGSFTSRINMNLREDKHWSYGSRMSVAGARGQRPYFVSAPVQTDATAGAIREILAEMRAITGSSPVTAEELAKAKDQATLTLPGRFETMSAVAGAIEDLVRFSLPADYHDTYAQKIRALTVEDMQTAVTSVLRPQALIWVVVGDRAKVEKGLAEAGLGEVHLLSADGRVLETAGVGQ